MGRGIYTADMGQPPEEPDMGSSPAPRRAMPVKRPMMSDKRAMPTKVTPRGIRGGVWTEDSGVPAPQDIDGASAKPYKKGGSVSSASRRADGIAKQGKTRCKMC